ncbi:MAG TPA: hypothetical protein VIZ43_10910 [Trebonia sp.]
MTEPAVFYDAVADKLRNVPDGADVVPYADGLYAAVPADLRRFGSVRWNTVFWDWRRAGCIDFEQGNPAYAAVRLRAYVAGRNKRSLRARVYASMSNVAKAHEILTGHGWHWEWWIATLDGRDWAPAELAAEIERLYGAVVDAGAVWANQNVGGVDAPWDRSNRFLPL